MIRYQDLYSWDNGLVEQGETGVLEHTDGAVSVAFTWSGYSTELKSSEHVSSLFLQYYKTLNQLPKHDDILIENHFLRTYDNSVCQSYVRYGTQHMTRYQEFGGAMRDAIASHISDMAMTNRIVTVVTMKQFLSPIAKLRAKATHQRIRKNAVRLHRIASDFAANLPGSRLLTYAELEQQIWAHYHRDLDRSSRLPGVNQRFRLSHRIASKPTWDDGFVRLGDTYTKVVLIVDYADAGINWFYELARQCGCEIHITQVLRPTDSGGVLAHSSTQTRKSLESASAIGGESERGKVDDHNDFRRYVADNDLAIFHNCFVIKMHHVDKELLTDLYRDFKNGLDPNMVVSDGEESIAMAFWRSSQIAQGHTMSYMRPDHTWQVAHMAPIICFDDGNRETPQMLRITSDATAVTFGFPRDGTNHTVTGAKTGGGKGVNTVAQISELFPLGFNFYISEVGASYKWVVEAFGGSYYHLDPNTTVVSPFPDYALADPKKEGYPLPADIVSPTIGALLPLLAHRNQPEMHVHITSVAEQIMQAHYALTENPATKAPTLADYYRFANDCKGEFAGVQNKAAQTIVENLESFLSSTAGSNFDRADTLNFDAGIVGVDFKPLMANEELAKFMLVFIALRYKQLAFANDTPTRIILDEQHEFNRIDAELIKTLAMQLTRMGRKEAGAYQGISQEILDMGLEPGILNQITHRELMYTQSGHAEIADVLKLNNTGLSRWRGYVDPESAGQSMNYRQCIRMVGDTTYDLQLRFPQILLDLAHSSPAALRMKEAIGKTTKDPFKRLQLFREAMNSRA